MYSLWTARDYLSGKELISGLVQNPRHKAAPGCFMVQGELLDKSRQTAVEVPIAFYSEDAHYSLTKTVALEQILTFYQAAQKLYPNEPSPLEEGWPYEVPSKDGAFGPGSVDIDKLTKLVKFFVDRGHPAIVILNYGSTFKGAYDDVEEAGKKIMDYLETTPGGIYNTFQVHYEGQPPTEVKRRKVWIHVDGALGASFMPFLEMAYKHKEVTLNALTAGARGKKAVDPPTKFPVFDFRLDYVCSIATSGHKWMGSPWPCGIFMTRSKLVL